MTMAALPGQPGEGREEPPHFVSLGMFIIDQFKYVDEDGNDTGKEGSEQMGGGGIYAAVGARIWLPAHKVGAIIDRGHDFPQDFQPKLESYGTAMWLFRDNAQMPTARALSVYRGESLSFDYLTPRRRLTPQDLAGTVLARPAHLHFVCSPARAAAIIADIASIPDWEPVTIYEPIPVDCTPEHLPTLLEVLPRISILSPNAEEALALLGMPLPPTTKSIEEAAAKLLAFGVGADGGGHVVIRCGALGAFCTGRARGGMWVDAYFTADERGRVVDVTGAGNAFLGGLSAGLLKTSGDVYAAVFYGAVSASFVVEQLGLPTLNETGLWNGEDPYQRLADLRTRVSPTKSKPPYPAQGNSS